MIRWLEDWLLKNSNDDWEHCNGIKIETVDNPGWYVEFDVRDTSYESYVFNRIENKRGKNDWVICFMDNGTIKASGGPQNLNEILEIIKLWIEENS